uniref:Uncharacterized protein n=1 Tax=Globisporangium ultimum (strain ATCC 200006 / CBS 805.95 / DAOM BR144) TaxID=431595 RepID=K3WC54_GLOUD
MFQSAVIHADFEFTNHNAVINAVCYNHHQDCFVSADDTCLRLWSPTAGENEEANGGGASAGGGERRQIHLPTRTTNFIQALEYIESRQLYVAAALNGTLKVYDLNMAELASVFTGRGTILSMVFDAARNRLFTGGVDGCAAWLVRGKPLGGSATDHGMNPHYELSPLPNFFHHHPAAGSGSHDDQHGLDADATGGSSSSSDMPACGAAKHSGARPRATAKTLETHQRPWVQNVQLNSDKTKLYAQSKHCVDVFSTTDGRFIETYADLFPKEHGAIMAFVVHEKTQYVVCGCINGWIFVVSLHPSSVLHVFKDHTLSITSLAVHASSNLIFSSSLDGTVRLWDLEARRQAHRLDIGQPVQGIQLLVPNANPCRFLCRVRSRIQLFRIQSTIKEYLPVLSPVCVLQRVLYPTHRGDVNRKIRSAIEVRKRYEDDDEEDLSSEDSDESDSDEASESQQTQVIVAAGMDKTIRLFAGRTANEAPSFTWTPEDSSLDLIGFVLNPCGKHLFLLLESQRIIIVDVENNQAHDKNKVGTPGINRVVDMSVPPPAFGGSSATQRQLSGQTSSTRDTLNSAGSRKKSQGIGSTSTTTAGSNTSSSGSWGGVRGSIRCICVCYYPPIFRSAVPSAEATASVTPTAQSKWFSRTFVTRRQPSSIALELKKAEEELTQESNINYQQHPHRRNALIQSEYEWIVCGSEFGHLLFWHTGLANNGKEAISIDAHDAAIISMAASTSSPLLVTLDDAKRANFWHLQPVFTLRHMLDLSEKPSCFVLSPVSELLLSGYDDGNILLMDVSDPSALETYSSDENHFAMVSAADFLDEKGIVLTASVDAMIKIWDQQKTLLRQIHIAMAFTSLCFMNASGDLMAGLSNGIFIVTKDDVLPEKVPKHPRKRKNNEGTLHGARKKIKYSRVH